VNVLDRGIRNNSKRKEIQKIALETCILNSLYQLESTFSDIPVQKNRSVLDILLSMDIHVRSKGKL
jgi:uncharacterized protein YfbU (UPF0304 family)